MIKAAENVEVCEEQHRLLANELDGIQNVHFLGHVSSSFVCCEDVRHEDNTGGK